MNSTIAVIALILITLYFIYIFNVNYKLEDKALKENFGGGALTQLYAKGPQDTYLTVNSEKYIPEYWWNQYPFFYHAWNIPTRSSQYYYPLYGIFPNNYFLYPYIYS